MAHELPQETRETIDQLIASPGANVLDVRLEEPLFMAWWDLVGQVLGKLLHFLWAELFERGFTPPDQVANSTGLVDTFGCRTNPGHGLRLGPQRLEKYTYTPEAVVPHREYAIKLYENYVLDRPQTKTLAG